MGTMSAIIAANRKRASSSPAYLEYKQRVEADAGLVDRSQAEMQVYYPVVRKAIWSHIVSGYKAGRLHTFFPNNAASDLNFSRNSKATRFNRDGKMVEALANVPALEYNPVTGAFEGCAFSPQVTNRIANSQNNVYTTASNVVISNHTWDFTSLYTHRAYFGDNTVERVLRKSNYVTDPVLRHVILSFFVEMEDGSEPRFDIISGSQVDFAIYIGGGPVGQDVTRSKYWKRRITDTVWYVSAYYDYTNTSVNNNIRKRTHDSNKAFWVTGMQIEQGTLAPGNHIVTTGTAATKLFDDATTPLVLPMNNIVLYADMVNKYAIGSSTVPRGFSLRLDASNYITVGFTQTGTIGMAIYQSGAVIMQITSPATSGKICARFVSGQFALVVNGVVYTSFTTGNQSLINPFANSVDVTIGSSQRNINVRAVAVLNNLSDSEMISLTE